MGKRAATTLDTCEGCQSRHRLLGDRDAQLRDLQARLARAQRAESDVAAVVAYLDGHGVPTTTARGERLSLVGRLRQIGGDL
mgnify:CR=1 FL=1